MRQIFKSQHKSILITAFAFGVAAFATTGCKPAKVTGESKNTSIELAQTIDSAFTELTISASRPDLEAQEQVTFVAQGGLTPYHFAIVTGEGAINPISGRFTASANAGTTVVSVIDSLGENAMTSVTTHPQLTIASSLGASGLATGQSTSLTVTGGMAPYTFSILGGGGSVNALSGALTAPDHASTITVRATDAIGGSVELAISVYSPLQLAASANQVALSGTLSFSASGGSTPYIYSIQSGTGSIDSATGAFTAPSTAETTIVRVTDSANRAASASVAVYSPLMLTRSQAYVTTGATAQFTASGGVSPYSYSVALADGTISLLAGSYAAPGTAGARTISVTDAIGAVATRTIEVVLPLALSSDVSSVALSSAAQFTASGGATPYTYEIASGGGSINSATGALTAPASSGTVTVRVTDAASTQASRAITVHSSLLLAASTAHVPVSGSAQFAASGGVPPYSFAITSGTGTVDAASGLYSAPASASLTETVTATDSIGATATRTVQVFAPLALTRSQDYVSAGGSAQFTASGGVSPYAYSVASSGPSGDGTISPLTGSYVAPGSEGARVITVTDAIGETSTSSVQVVLPLALAASPSDRVVTLGTLSFSATGGIAPYSFEILTQNNSGAPNTPNAIDATTGAFTAGSILDSVTVRVTDSATPPFTATRTITVFPALALTLSTSTLGSSMTANYTFSGGVPPYTLTSDHGALSPSSSTAGTYTAPVKFAVPSQSGLPLGGSGLAAYYKFNEASYSGTSNVFADSSGNNRPMSRSLASLGNSNGGDGKALNFANTGASATRAAVVSGTGAWSASIWIKRDASSDGWTYPLQLGSGASGRYTQLIVGSNTAYFVRPSGAWVAASANFPAQAWNHLALSYDGAGTTKFYLNGALSAQASGSFNLAATTQALASTNTQVDELMIFNRAISSTEVATLHSGNASKATLTLTDSVGNTLSSDLALIDAPRLGLAVDRYLAGHSSQSFTVSGGLGPYQIHTTSGGTATFDVSTNTASGASGTMVVPLGSADSVVSVIDSLGQVLNYAFSSQEMFLNSSEVSLLPGESFEFWAYYATGSTYYSSDCGPTVSWQNSNELVSSAATPVQDCTVTAIDTNGATASAIIHFALPIPTASVSSITVDENGVSDDFEITDGLGSTDYSITDDCAGDVSQNLTGTENFTAGAVPESCTITVTNNSYPTQSITIPVTVSAP